MSLLNGASILITGGTGSFGKAFLREVLDNHNPRRVVVFSLDELKQYEVRNQFGNDPRLRRFLGDIRDMAADPAGRACDCDLHGVPSGSNDSPA